MRLLKNLVKAFLRRRGYELYCRPYLPKGVDPYESLRAQWPDWRPRVIFDVGANVGQTVARLRPLFPEAQVHAFEPVPATFELLRQATAGDPLVAAHCLALADRAGEEWILEQPKSDLNSLNPVFATEDSGGPKVRVDLETMARFCAQRGIAHIDLLKLDVEGFELQVLQGAQHLLERGSIDFIVAEVGLMLGKSPFTPLPRLLEHLEPHGFWLVGIYEQLGWRHRQAAEFSNVLLALEKHLA